MGEKITQVRSIQEEGMAELRSVKCVILPVSEFGTEKNGKISVLGHM